jgi:dolichol kinase
VITNNEIFRKLIHVFNAVIPLGYLFLIPARSQMVVILAVLSLLFLGIDYGRLRVRWIRQIFAKLFDFMLRSHELEGKLTGATWVLFGSFVTVLLFPKELAVLALLFLSIGDTAAALVGMQFGRIKFWGKSLEGSLAGLIACLLVAAAFSHIPWMIKGAGAVTAMVIEVLPIPIDDNLRIPFASGAVMSLLGVLGT